MGEDKISRFVDRARLCQQPHAGQHLAARRQQTAGSQTDPCQGGRLQFQFCRGAELLEEQIVFAQGAIEQPGDQGGAIRDGLQDAEGMLAAEPRPFFLAADLQEGRVDQGPSIRIVISRQQAIGRHERVVHEIAQRRMPRRRDDEIADPSPRTLGHRGKGLWRQILRARNIAPKILPFLDLDLQMSDMNEAGCLHRRQKIPGWVFA